MANYNPVIPVMDSTEYAELHKRYIERKEEVELELGSSLSNRSNSVKSMCSDGQVSQLETISKSLPDSEFKYEGASTEAILEALEEKTKPKCNEIAASTKLCSLKQGIYLCQGLSGRQEDSGWPRHRENREFGC